MDLRVYAEQPGVAPDSRKSEDGANYLRRLKEEAGQDKTCHPFRLQEQVPGRQRFRRQPARVLRRNERHVSCQYEGEPWFSSLSAFGFGFRVRFVSHTLFWEWRSVLQKSNRENSSTWSNFSPPWPDKTHPRIPNGPGTVASRCACYRRPENRPRSNQAVLRKQAAPLPRRVLPDCQTGSPLLNRSPWE